MFLVTKDRIKRNNHKENPIHDKSSNFFADGVYYILYKNDINFGIINFCESFIKQLKKILQI